MSETDQEFRTYCDAVVTTIQARTPDAVTDVISEHGELTVVVDRAAFTKVCTLVRDDPQLSFNYLCDLSAVDMWPEHPRFEINLHLLALPRGRLPRQGAQRLRLKVRLEEDAATLPTLTGLWRSAAWYERETNELFGIKFEGHPDMRRLLLPDEWEGTPPLRRDVPVHVEEVAFTFNRERIYRNKPFAKE